MEISQATPKSTFRVYLDDLLRDWLIYVLGFLSIFLCAITEVLVPKFIQWSIDLVSQKTTAAIPAFLQKIDIPTTLEFIIGLALLNLIAGYVFRIGWRQFLARKTHAACHRYRTDYWRDLRWLSESHLHKYSLGDLLNRGINDLNYVRFMYGFTWALTLDMVFLLGLGLVAMVSIDPLLTLYCMLPFTIFVFPMRKLAHLQHQNHSRAQQLLGHLSEMINQSLTTIRLQRATATEGSWLSRLASTAGSHAEAHFQTRRSSISILPLALMPTWISYLILITVGLSRIESGQLSIGGLAALFSFVLIMQTPLIEVGEAIAEWQKAFIGLRRIREILLLGQKDNRLRRRSYISLARSMAHLPPHKPLIELVNFSFQHTSMDRPILKELNLKIMAKEKLGLLGDTAAGKTTLLKALLHAFPLEKDQIFIAGHDLTQVSADELAREMVMVPQNAFLFANSIRSNLCLGDLFNDDQLFDILKVVALDDFVRSLPQGLDTPLGEWGINLSGGQRQRMTLARALLRPRKIMLLDDCLSAVDSITEQRILDHIMAHMQDSTVIWVAHRRSTLRLCDRIYKIEANASLRKVSSIWEGAL